MNLAKLANQAVTVVNPNVAGTWRQCTGATRDAASKRVPTYTNVPNTPMQVQAMSGDDLRKLDATMVQGIMRAVYVFARVEGNNRAVGIGPDMLQIPTGYTSPGPDTWAVVQVLEPWDGATGWTKVASRLQLPS